MDTNIPNFEKTDAVLYRWYSYLDGRWKASCWYGNTIEEAKNKLESELAFELKKYPLKLVCERTTFIEENF